MTDITYAIGDIHGRLHEFEQLLAKIDTDMAQYPKGTKFRIVQVGDLIDRGEDSRGVVELCMKLPEIYQDRAEVVILRGNHEYVFLKLYDGDMSDAKGWYLHKHQHGGGVRAMESYGAPEITDLDKLTTELPLQMQKFIPAEHVDFFRSLPVSFEDETYFFSHGGINPKLSLAEQDEYELMWIRDGFVDAEFDAEKIIVHGHTPTKGGEILPYRVNTDAGAAYGLDLHAVVLPNQYDPENTRILSVEVAAESDWQDE